MDWRGEVSWLQFFGNFYRIQWSSLQPYTPSPLLAFKPFCLLLPLINNNTLDLKDKVGGHGQKLSFHHAFSFWGEMTKCLSYTCVWKLHHIQSLTLWKWDSQCPQVWGKVTPRAIWVWQAFWDQLFPNIENKDIYWTHTPAFSGNHSVPGN